MWRVVIELLRSDCSVRPSLPSSFLGSRLFQRELEFIEPLLVTSLDWTLGTGQWSRPITPTAVVNRWGSRPIGIQTPCRPPPSQWTPLSLQVPRKLSLSSLQECLEMGQMCGLPEL